MLHLYTLLHSSVYTPRLTHRSGKKKKDIKQKPFNRSWSRSGAKLTARPCLIHLNSQSPIYNPKVRLWALSCGLARGKLLNAASPNCVVITLSDTATAPDLIYNSWQPSDVGEAGGTALLLSGIHPGAKLSQLFHPITKCKMLSYCCGSMINTAPGWIPDKSSAVEAEIQWKKPKRTAELKKTSTIVVSSKVVWMETTWRLLVLCPGALTSSPPPRDSITGCCVWPPERDNS